MKVCPIEFEFKDDRHYIQGPDIFNKLINLSLTHSIRNIRFTAHDFIRNPKCLVHLANEKEKIMHLPNVRAQCQFEDDGILRWLAVTECNEQKGMSTRRVYNEEQLTSICQLDQNTLVLSKPSPFTFIGSIVSMNKFLHQKIFPDALGKWIFTRVDLNSYCDERQDLAVCLKHNMNFRLTKSDILVAGNKIGELYFSLLKA